MPYQGLPSGSALASSGFTRLRLAGLHFHSILHYSTIPINVIEPNLALICLIWLYFGDID